MFIVQEDDVRLDRYLRNILSDPLMKKQSFIEKCLRKKYILVDEKKAKSSDRIKQGQRITFSIDLKIPLQKTNINLVDKTLDIIYQDENIVVINKPYNIPTQGGRKIHTSIDSLTNDCLITHRIDKEVSGALILAKNRSIAKNICKSFAERRVKKTYLAIITGIPQNKSFKITYPLQKKNMSHHKKTLDAVTYFELIDYSKKNNVSLLKITPLTGRKHQIRIHMSLINHPIIGDKKYGDKGKFTISGIALHAWKIKLENGDEFIAPIQKNMPLKELELSFLENISTQSISI